MNPTNTNIPQNLQPESPPLPDTTNQETQDASPVPAIQTQAAVADAKADQLIASLATEKDHTKVKIVGLGVLILSLLSIVSSIGLPTFMLGIHIAGVILGIGILNYNKIAYTAFNVIAALNIISTLFSLNIVVSIVVGLLTYPMLAVYYLLAILTVLAVPGFYMYGIFALHPHRVRQLFN